MVKRALLPNDMSKITLTTNLKRRKTRVRSKIWGTAECPRLSVRRTNTRMIAQAVNDETKTTVACASDFDLAKADQKKPKSERAQLVGKMIGEKLATLKVKSVVFDRNGYLYHGRVQKLAEGVREAGIVF